MTGGPWYNTSICKKLHGKLFEGFFRNARTNRYDMLCSIDAHEKEQQSSCDDVSSDEGSPIPKHSRTEALYFLHATIDFIDWWIKVLE